MSPRRSTNALVSHGNALIMLLPSHWNHPTVCTVVVNVPVATKFYRLMTARLSNIVGSEPLDVCSGHLHVGVRVDTFHHVWP